MVTKAIKDLFKKKMVMEKDFDLDPEHNDPTGTKMCVIKIKKGKYAGVSFRFGTIKVEDKENSDGTYTIHFDYDIINPNGHDPDKLNQNKTFQTTLGGILNSIILTGIERDLKEHDEKIGNDYTEESDTRRRVRKKSSSVSE